MPQEITVRLHTYGIEEVGGHRARKVGRDDVPYFKRIGWRVARRTGSLVSSYVRMYPSDGGDTKRPEIHLMVPTEEEIRALAERLHAAGQPWRGELCAWPARYIPRKIERHQHTVIAVFEDGPREHVETYERVDPAEFSVASPASPWCATLIWRDGDDTPPHFLAQID
jgi:hypothetical protein